MRVRFEWDLDKAEANRRKHKVSFETALRVFADPFALSEQDRIEGASDGGGPSARSRGTSSWWWRTPSATGRTRTGGPSRSSASSRCGPPIGRRGGAMSKRTARREVDLAALPPLTAEQEA